MAERRSNIFEIIVYPDDSLPDYWIDIIDKTHVPCAVSPVHNLDLYNKADEVNAQEILNNPNITLCSKDVERLQCIKDGVNKKVHRHILINYGLGANKTISQVQEDFVYPLNAFKFPNFVRTERGTFRYLIHLDHPNKAQYSRDDIRIFNGYDPKDFLELSSAQVEGLGNVITRFADDNHISCYFELERLTRFYMPWHKWVLSHTIFLTAWFKDRLTYSEDFSDYSIKEEKIFEFIESSKIIQNHNSK